MKEADAQGILAPTQAGFRKHYTTIEQALTVQQLVQYSICAKQPLGLLFIDLDKAYDRVDRQALWEDMAHKLNIPGSLV